MDKGQFIPYPANDTDMRYIQTFDCCDKANDISVFYACCVPVYLSFRYIIIRTGGEKRLSNFLLYQSAYSELFFVDTLWPDFSNQELDSIIAQYGERDRRYGKV